MDLDDSRIRNLVLTACPGIIPRHLEVCENDHGATVGFWYRRDDGTIQRGSTIALNRTEAEVASEIATQLLSEQAKTEITAAALVMSPYEGKRGKHPNKCTCSKHLKADSGETQ